MSGIIKSVIKVFKKVVKVIKKVAPYVVAAAAIYFTAGAALGATAGFGASMSSAATSLFGPGLLADTVAGAVTQAGYGALIGGGLAAITGKSITKGMQAGALTGAVTGGAMGAWNSPYTFANPTTLPSAASGALNPTVPYNTADPVIGGANTDTLSGTKIPLVSPEHPLTYSSSAPAVPPVRTGLLGFWDEVKNSELASGIAGGVVKGIGEGLFAGNDPTGRIEAARIQAETAAAAKRAAYIGTGGTGGLLTESTKTAFTNPTPGQRWGYGYNPTTGQVTVGA